MKKVAILGVTGSIGTTALKGIENHKERLSLCCASYHLRKPQNLTCPLLQLDERCLGLCEFLRENKPDVVLNAIGGTAGLKASIEVLNAGFELALANKETIVLGGNLFLDYAKKKGITVIPVDSEHSAIDELILTNGRQNIEKLVITASGGPFLNTPLNELEKVSPQMAVKHPTWNMGPKISIDSSTLANKGLEVIEAHYLFNFSANDIEVVIHPQSIIHSMVRTTSGQVYAQMSPPDMTFPIMRALLNRNFSKEVGKELDFTSLNLTFRKPDLTQFPFLKDAYFCIEKEGWYPLVYNAADEVAVKRFTEGHIKFNEIHDVVSKALDMNWGTYNLSLEDIPSAVIEVISRINQACH